MDEHKRTFFNGIAADWDGLPQAPDLAAGITRFVHRAARPDVKAILDVGCGTGVLVPELLAAFPNVESIIELDFAEQMLLRNASKFADPRLVRMQGDATDLSLPDSSIDLALCFNVVPHLGSPDSAFTDLFRVLANGGVLAVAHLMSSQQLNDFHSHLDGPVSQDRLIPACELATVLENLGARRVVAEEEPSWYFVRAEKQE